MILEHNYSQFRHEDRDAHILSLYLSLGFGASDPAIENSEVVYTPPRLSIFKTITRKTKRGDKEIGVVTYIYKPVTEDQIVEFFENFLLSRNEDVNKAVILVNDKERYVVYQYEVGVMIDEEEKYTKYFTVINGLDGTKSFQVRVMFVRFKCANQLPIFDKIIKFRHTDIITDNIDKLKALNKVTDDFNVDISKYRQKAHTDFISNNIEDIREYLLDTNGKDVISTRMSNIWSNFVNTLSNGIGQAELEKYTLFWLINGVVLFIKNQYEHEFLELDNNPMHRKLKKLTDLFLKNKLELILNEINNTTEDDTK